MIDKHSHHEHDACTCSHKHHKHHEQCEHHEQHEHHKHFEQHEHHGQHDHHEHFEQHEHHEQHGHHEQYEHHNHHEHHEHCEHHNHHEHHEHCEHHEHQDVSKFPCIEIDTHDSAVIGTVKCRIPGDYEAALQLLTEKMNTTAQRIEKEGGLVGHIKCFAREELRNCMISIPEAGDIQMKQNRSASVNVENANIVFGITEMKLLER